MINSAFVSINFDGGLYLERPTRSNRRIEGLKICCYSSLNVACWSAVQISQIIPSELERKCAHTGKEKKSLTRWGSNPQLPVSSELCSTFDPTDEDNEFQSTRMSVGWVLWSSTNFSLDPHNWDRFFEISTTCNPDSACRHISCWRLNLVSYSLQACRHCCRSSAFALLRQYNSNEFN